MAFVLKKSRIWKPIFHICWWLEYKFLSKVQQLIEEITQISPSFWVYFKLGFKKTEFHFSWPNSHLMQQLWALISFIFISVWARRRFGLGFIFGFSGSPGSRSYKNVETYALSEKFTPALIVFFLSKFREGVNCWIRFIILLFSHRLDLFLSWFTPLSLIACLAFPPPSKVPT